jgi:hypothetical protein
MTQSQLHTCYKSVFVSETRFQSRRSGLSSDNATELYASNPYILLFSAYVPLSCSSYPDQLLPRIFS